MKESWPLRDVAVCLALPNGNSPRRARAGKEAIHFFFLRIGREDEKARLSV